MLGGRRTSQGHSWVGMGQVQKGRGKRLWRSAWSLHLASQLSEPLLAPLWRLVFPLLCSAHGEKWMPHSTQTQEKWPIDWVQMSEGDRIPIYWERTAINSASVRWPLLVQSFVTKRSGTCRSSVAAWGPEPWLLERASVLGRQPRSPLHPARLNSKHKAFIIRP
jgi:hypothetical protein